MRNSDPPGIQLQPSNHFSSRSVNIGICPKIPLVAPAIYVMKRTQLILATSFPDLDASHPLLHVLSPQCFRMTSMTPDHKDEETVVFEIQSMDSSCDVCGEELGPGRHIQLVEGPDGKERAHCLSCTGLDDLVFVPTGDHRLSRRVRARSERQAVVVKWARARDRYERQGYLVEEPILTIVLEEFEGEDYEPAFELEDGTWIPWD